MTQLLYDAALITSGFSVDSPKEFGQRMYTVMQQVLGAGALNNSNGISNAGDAGPVNADRVVGPEDGNPSDPWRK